MRVALISDIHGNLVALEAVLAAIHEFGVDEIICLGDVAATGPQPRECLQRLAAVGCPVVMGNTDERFADPSLAIDEDGSTDEDWARFLTIDAWCRAQVTEAERTFARTFLPSVELELAPGVSFLGYHGSPRSNREAIFPTTPPEALAESLDGATATLMAGGHTHEVMLRRFRQSLVLNPGSVGMPYEQQPTGGIRHPPWAEWALLSIERGQVQVEFRRTSVDVSAVVRSALNSRMPHAAWWTRGWKA